MKLLVYWGTDEKADLQVPEEVKWEDGSPASLNDYRLHNSATQTSFATDKGLVTVISPDVVAVTRFDVDKGHWLLDAPGGDPFMLEETDPDACDDVLIQEISCYPVAYKTTFNRSHLPIENAVATPTVTYQPAIQ